MSSRSGWNSFVEILEMKVAPGDSDSVVIFQKWRQVELQQLQMRKSNHQRRLNLQSLSAHEALDTKRSVQPPVSG